MNPLLRSLLSFLLLVPPSVSGQSLGNPVRKETPMWTLAECGRKQSRAFAINPRQEVAQRKSDDLGSAQPGEGFEFVQNFQVGTSESNGSGFTNGLHHDSANLQGGLPLVDVTEQSKVHQNYICNTNDIHGQPESSASGTAPRLSSNVRDSDISSSLPPLDWLLDPEKSKSLSDRVLARLIQAEAHEREAQYQTSLRLSWQIVYHAAKGDAVECSPTTLAYYSVVGCHEEDYYPKLIIRRAAMFGDGNRIPLSGRTAAGLADSIPQAKTRLEPEVRNGVFVSLPDSLSARKQRGKPSQAGADKRATPPSRKSAPVPQIQKKESA